MRDTSQFVMNHPSISSPTLLRCMKWGASGLIWRGLLGTRSLGWVVRTHCPQWGGCGFCPPCQHGAHHVEHHERGSRTTMVGVLKPRSMGGPSHKFHFLQFQKGYCHRIHCIHCWYCTEFIVFIVDIEYTRVARLKMTPIQENHK